MGGETEDGVATKAAAGGVKRPPPRPRPATRQAPDYPGWLRALAASLLRTRQNIDANNPNRIEINFHTKQRWSDEVQNVLVKLNELAEQMEAEDAGGNSA